MKLLADGMVRAVDVLLKTEKQQLVYRFRLDAKNRVVEFTRQPRTVQ